MIGAVSSNKLQAIAVLRCPTAFMRPITGLKPERPLARCRLNLSQGYAANVVFTASEAISTRC